MLSSKRLICLTSWIGTDIKSLAINLASIILMFLPFAIYYDPDNTMNFCLSLGVSFLFAYVMPPVGWKRPHPYSDDPLNVPP